MALTTIRCTTCTSTVPWGPHCPSCGAYLEFAGDPPWQPAPAEIVGDGSEQPDVVEPADVEQVAVEQVTAEELVVAAPAPTTPAAMDAPSAGRSVRAYVPTIGVLLTGALVTPLMWWSAGTAVGIAVAVVFVAWAAVLLPRHRAPEPIDAPVAVETVVESVVVEEVVTGQARVDHPLEVRARPPQALPRRAVESTRGLAVKEPEGDVPCPACARLNLSGQHFCRWCGTSLPDALLAPTTVVHQTDDAHIRQDKDTRRSRPRLSRSWRGPLLALMLAGVLLSSIIFAVFGPNAFQVRFGMTQVYQLINQFIDPYAGQRVAPTTAEASSTLLGTSAQDLLASDASTFWASQPTREQGAGSELYFGFEDRYTINRMVIRPGIQNSVLDVRSVSTPRAITLTFDDGSTYSAELDLVQSSNDLSQLIRFPKVTTQYVYLKIDSVYPPRAPAEQAISEVAISSVYFIAPPAPPRVFNLPTDVQPRMTLPGTN
jgi:hypothetical protein